MQDIRI